VIHSGVSFLYNVHTHINEKTPCVVSVNITLPVSTKN